MRIENSGAERLNRPDPSATRPVEKNGAARGSQAADRAAGRDGADLSERARALSRARAALEETPEVREELVTRFKQEIESGAYEVPHAKLVQALLHRLGLE